MNERMNYITYLRVFAMMSVVLGHTLTYNSSWGVPLYKIIFSYHIPLFVFISGFCFRISENRKESTIIKLILIKIKKLLLPAFIVSVLVVLPTELFITKVTTFSGIGERLLSIFSGNVSHLWFLLMLFWIFVLFIPLEFLNRKLKGEILYIVVFGATIYLFLKSKYLVNIHFYSIDKTARYMYYFCLGILIATYKDKINTWILKHKNIVIPVLGILVLCSINFMWQNWKTYIGAWFICEHLNSFIIISTIIIVALYCFALVKSNKLQTVSREILFLEKESLIIYYVHIFFGEIANKIMFEFGERFYLTAFNKFIFTFFWMMGMSCILAFYYEKVVTALRKKIYKRLGSKLREVE